MGSGCSAAVDHSPGDHEVEGLNSGAGLFTSSITFHHNKSYSALNMVPQGGASQ